MSSVAQERPPRLSELRLKLLDNNQSQNAKNAVFQGVVFFFSSLMVIPLILILGFILVKGVEAFRFAIFTSDESGQGVLHAIVGSLIMVGIACVIAIPISIFTGLYLANKKTGTFANILRIIVDVLQGIPSIVVGILAYVWFVVPLRTFSALAGGIALAIMMLPIVIKNTEESLKLIPQSLHEAGYALGAPRHLVLLQIILPSGISGVITGVLIGVSRVLGETAPLIFTAFGNPSLNADIGKPMEALAPLIYKYYTQPTDWQVQNAWAACFILIVFILALNLTTRLVTRRWQVKL